MKMILVQTYLTAEQKKSLDNLSKETDIPRAALIRQGLEIVMKKHKDLLKIRRIRRGGGLTDGRSLRK